MKGFDNRLLRAGILQPLLSGFALLAIVTQVVAQSVPANKIARLESVTEKFANAQASDARRFTVTARVDRRFELMSIVARPQSEPFRSVLRITRDLIDLKDAKAILQASKYGETFSQ